MTATCSAHGYCDATGTCICNDGWSGNGEFIDRTGRDCNVSATGVMTLHIIGVIVACCGLVVAMRANYRAIHKTIRQQQQRRVIVAHAFAANNNNHFAAGGGHGGYHAFAGSPGGTSPGQSVIHPTPPHSPQPVAIATAAPSPQHAVNPPTPVAATPIAAMSPVAAASSLLRTRRVRNGSCRELTRDPASQVGLGVNGIAITSFLYHLQRAIHGDGNQINRAWNTSVFLWLALAFFWPAMGRFVWLLARQQTTLSITSRDTNGVWARVSMRRMQRLLVAGGVSGSLGALCALWCTAATSDDSREAAMITFYSLMAFAGFAYGSAFVYYSIRIIKQIDTLKQAQQFQVQRRRIICISMLLSSMVTDKRSSYESTSTHLML